jgi:glycosyltransferase involved in cell wall biosynthesis
MNVEVLSIVLPMFNEEALVRHTVEAVLGASGGLVESGRICDYEIVVVDDGSTDATARIADELASVYARVSVVHHERNYGLGRAIRSGLALARGSLVLYMDGDLPFDLRELDGACSILCESKADVFSAYRLNRASEGLRRTCYSFVYNALVRVVFKLRLRDVNFAFKMFRRDVVDRIELTSEGSFIDAEMLIGSHRLGYRIAQHGVRYFPRTRGVSTLSSLPTVAIIVRELLAFRSRSRGIVGRRARSSR